MPSNFKFSESTSFQNYTRTVLENGEQQISVTVDGAPISQTLPAKPDSHPALLCFDNDSKNFYWQRLVAEDSRPDFFVVESFGI